MNIASIKQERVQETQEQEMILGINKTQGRWTIPGGAATGEQDISGDSEDKPRNSPLVQVKPWREKRENAENSYRRETSTSRDCQQTAEQNGQEPKKQWKKFFSD